jgi:hypothetical protein
VTYQRLNMSPAKQSTAITAATHSIHNELSRAATEELASSDPGSDGPVIAQILLDPFALSRNATPRQ